MSYRAFLAAKASVAPRAGFDVPLDVVNPALKPHTRLMVQWGLSGGRRAWFASFGLHKTATQIEAMRLVAARTGRPTLIVIPLGVRQEFFREVRLRFSGEHAVDLRFVRTSAEVGQAGVYLTNYESVREGKIDVGLFAGASLDEAACLRGFGGTKTFREFMRLFDQVPYRFVATATPSPNEYIELLAYSAFLGVMDVGQAKTRFFRRDSEHADRLTLHPHKEREFWLWVASWGLFVQKPSDLDPTFSDEGYDLPGLDVRWHEIASDHAAAGAERDGQGRLFKNAALGVQDAAREKRDSLGARVAKMMELRAEDPGAHRILWHDLEAERRAIEAAVPNAVAVYGAQDLDERERAIAAFADGEVAELAAKPVMLGSGTNLQRHCAWHVFLGIGFKFNDFIQAVHRLLRFGQPSPVVRLDLIHTEAERDTRRALEAKWRRHEELVRIMTGIIREYGLTDAAMGQLLARSIGVERVEVEGENHRLVNADCVEETARMEADSVDLIVSSIPFSTQYEYTPSYNDFGHTDDDAHFWAQMDFLTPQLLRVLRPGRVAAIHVKDRIVPGGLTGLGFQTLSPFSDDCVAHFRRHGFAFLGRKTITTDVVRENNQTYRLGWSEQCKDGSRMGCGTPEYLLLFRKPPSDRSDGYADVPVVKAKRVHGPEGWRDEGEGQGYSRARWQLDAHGYAKSSGNRQLKPEELVGLAPDVIYKVWKAYDLDAVYDFEHHVRVGEALEAVGRLPPTFMLLPPHSRHPDVWSDVARMLTLNGSQAAQGREMHLCPLQFDIVDRAIVQFSMAGETVFDPFGGLMTVPYRAVRLGRKGVGVELNPRYFLDGVAYVEAAARDKAMPSLFDLMGAEASAEAGDPSLWREAAAAGLAKRDRGEAEAEGAAYPEAAE
ncbi:MAG TPA: DNA methyltransferase [Beijerinckiaceae bacterium]|nr:DNA methyltransferase [Beijerinckiaceae bacterium]